MSVAEKTKTITINHHRYLLNGFNFSDYYEVDIIPDYDIFEDGMACNGVAFCYDMGDTIDVHYNVSITPKGKNKSKVVLDEQETKEDFGYVNDSVFVMICEWIDNRYGKELFESKKTTKRSLKESTVLVKRSLKESNNDLKYWIDELDNIVNWHNKNLTKKQYYFLDELLDFLKTL